MTLNPDPVGILMGVRHDHPGETEEEIARAQWKCITQTAWWQARNGQPPAEATSHGFTLATEAPHSGYLFIHKDQMACVIIGLVEESARIRAEVVLLAVYYAKTGADPGTLPDIDWDDVRTVRILDADGWCALAVPMSDEIVL